MSYYPRGHHRDRGDEVDDFDDYDPHPYDGGCNLLFSYGKPLPPTPEICHPPTPIISPHKDIPWRRHHEEEEKVHDHKVEDKIKHGMSSLAEFIHPKDRKEPKHGGEKSDDDDDEDEEKKKHHHRHHFHRKHYDD